MLKKVLSKLALGAHQKFTELAEKYQLDLEPFL